jgi:hypothetical protein
VENFTYISIEQIAIDMSKKSTSTFKVGRDAGSGQFIKVSEAKRNPKTTTVETIKIIKK